MCVIGLFWAVLRACLHGGGGPQVGEVTCGGSPHLSCKRDQIKIRDYYGQVGPPPPWKQALSPFSKTRINTKSLIRKWFPNSNTFEFEQNSFWYENFGFWVSEMDYPLLLENIERWLCTIYSGGGGGGGFGVRFIFWKVKLSNVLFVINFFLFAFRIWEFRNLFNIFSAFPCSLERAASAGAVREKPPAPDHRPGKLILRHYARQTFNFLHDIGLLRSWTLFFFLLCIFLMKAELKLTLTRSREFH